MAKLKLPKGYRLLKPGERVKRGDRYSSCGGSSIEHWELSRNWQYNGGHQSLGYHYIRQKETRRKQDRIFALRCFVDGKRKSTHKLTPTEASIIKATAQHLIKYLNETYGV